MQAVKDVQIESKQLHEQIKKLEKMLEAYQSESIVWMGCIGMWSYILIVENMDG